MLKIFKRNSKREKLEKKILKLLKEWQELYSVNRAASEKKYFEAQKIAIHLKNSKHEINY